MTFLHYNNRDPGEKKVLFLEIRIIEVCLEYAC